MLVPSSEQVQLSRAFFARSFFALLGLGRLGEAYVVDLVFLKLARLSTGAMLEQFWYPGPSEMP